MEKFVLFEIHDYSNEFPRKYVKIFRGQSEEDIRTSALRFAYSMYHDYSGGTIRLIKIRSLARS